MTEASEPQWERLHPASFIVSALKSLPQLGFGLPAGVSVIGGRNLQGFLGLVAVGAALSAFLLWGLTSQGSMALLVLFSVTFGFFAGGYSATWGRVLDELEREARASNEAVLTWQAAGGE